MVSSPLILIRSSHCSCVSIHGMAWHIFRFLIRMLWQFQLSLQLLLLSDEQNACLLHLPHTICPCSTVLLLPLTVVFQWFTIVWCVNTRQFAHYTPSKAYVGLQFPTATAVTAVDKSHVSPLFKAIHFPCTHTHTHTHTVLSSAHLSRNKWPILVCEGCTCH
jgi:hypothetical protein